MLITHYLRILSSLSKEKLIKHTMHIPINPIKACR